MKIRNTVFLIVLVVVVAAVGFIAVNGLRINEYIRVKPVGEAISLGLDLRGGVYAVYQAESEGVENFDVLLSGTIEVLRNRLDGQGFTEATVTQQGVDRIRVEIPDVSNTEEIVDIIGTPALLEFVDPNGTVIMTGADVQTAAASYLDAQYVVSFDLTDEGSQIFAEATQEFLGQAISIQLDGNVISAPSVDAVITGGSGYIKGNFTLEDAQELAMLIQSGALPLEIQEIEVRSVSATLGVEALDKSLMAGLIGICLVFAFMIVRYRFCGLIASFALVIFMLLDFYALALMPGVQLTIHGIAGIVLTIGMAVDANVITYERIREEIALGKSLRASADAGFKNAMSAIIDSNITTMIAGFVLMFFGTGSIKGFAITLLVGVIASMITAVIISRALVRSVLKAGFSSRKIFIR